MLTIRVKTFALPRLAIISGLVYLLITILFIPHYLHWDGNLFTALVLAPFICVADSSRHSSRFLLPALLIITLAVFIPVNTMLFLALVLAALLWAENIVGKLNNSFMFLLFVISPVFKYLTGMFDFPVRLWLTSQTATLLTFTGVKAIAMGNQIRLANQDFSVDPACAGLNMLIISLLLSLFILTHFQRQLDKYLKFIFLAGFFIVVIGLNVICNFFRIFLLVSFRIMPGTFFHDFVGIACLMIYVIAPLVMGVKPLLKHLGKTRSAPSSAKAKPPLNIARHPALHVVLSAVLLFISLHLVNADTLLSKGKSIKLPGFTKYEMDNGISKFYNKDALIYLKPTVFYAPEHDPMICWTGSGYQFAAIQKEKISGVEVYTGTLEKGTDKIYAAWWFDNGHIKTINQLQWRWPSMIDGKHPFYLVNVNTSEPDKLRTQVTNLIKLNPIIK
jgi:exosortase N